MVGKGVAKLGDTVYQWMGTAETKSSTSQQVRCVQPLAIMFGLYSNYLSQEQ